MKNLCVVFVLACLSQLAIADGTSKTSSTSGNTGGVVFIPDTKPDSCVGQ